ncbi:MAG: hypothetical protein WCA20_16935 [Candidatus Sulfotelmatobacter sp.]
MLREGIVALIVAAFGSPQTALVVDLATVAPRNRVREPATASSSGGAVGGSGVIPERKGPVDMNLLSVELAYAPEPYLVFEVQVQNTSGDELEFPVDPNLADFEPENATMAYAYTAARITPFLDLKHQGNMFLRGVSLYGSEYVTGSLKKLDRGESVRIRARTPLKPVGPNSASKIPTRFSVKADLLMQRDVVSQKSGVLQEDSKQIATQITSLNAVAFSFGP